MRSTSPAECTSISSQHAILLAKSLRLFVRAGASPRLPLHAVERAGVRPPPFGFASSINMQDEMLVALLLLACDCTGEDVQACLFRGIDGQLGDVDVAWLLKRLDDDTRDFLCL